VINPKICRGCGQFVRIDDPEYDDNGDIVSSPAIVCSNPDGYGNLSSFFLGDKPPLWCPFRTEQVVCSEGNDTKSRFWGPK
jgi:hypothetical protein